MIEEKLFPMRFSQLKPGMFSFKSTKDLTANNCFTHKENKSAPSRGFHSQGRGSVRRADFPSTEVFTEQSPHQRCLGRDQFNLKGSGGKNKPAQIY